MKAFVVLPVLVASLQTPGIEEAGTPLCGMYCVYAAAHYCGVPIAFSPLVHQKYVSSREGSSAADIQRALADHGLSGKLRSSMTLSQLAAARGPVVLHVRAQGESQTARYRHWILFLGFDERGARVYDPPRTVDSISAAELLSIWDGVGIAVSGESSTVANVMPPLEGLAAFFLVVCCQLGLSGRRGATTIVGSAILAATIWLGFAAGVGIVGRQAVRNVLQPGDGLPIPELSFQELQLLTKERDVIIVDARPAGAFAAGHIDGAVNVPVTSGYVGFRNAVAGIPRAACVVVYCSNERCGWADLVAGHLVRFGFHDVRVFRGGYAEWRERR